MTKSISRYENVLLVGLAVMALLAVMVLVPNAAKASGGSISGILFKDLNKNGVRDAGEQALPGWTVVLNGGVTTTTDSNGNYTFGGLADGTYTLSEVLVNNNWIEETGPSPVAITSGSNSTGNNFANVKK